MSDADRDRLLPHAQDGIEEYDNPLPGWWVWIFWVTIVFSIGYWGYYQLGPGPSVVAVYEAEMKATAERQPKVVASAVTDASLAALEKDRDEPTLHLLLGNLYSQSGLPEQAHQSFDEARFLMGGKLRR